MRHDPAGLPSWVAVASALMSKAIAQVGACRFTVVAAFVAECVCLFVASRHGDFTVSGEASRFVPWMWAGGIAFLVAALSAARRPGFFSGAVGFWAACIILRLAMWHCEPGDDFWRYGWEGKVILAGNNPYIHPPTDPALAAMRDATWSKINHPHVCAIYPPGVLWLFAGVQAICGGITAFKAFFALADMVTIAFLVSLCGGGTAGRKAAQWYAWNPAVIYAFIGGAHYDSLMIVFVLAAVWFLQRCAAATHFSWRTAVTIGGCLGGAIAMKIIPIFLLPVWFMAMRRQVKVAALTLSIAGLIPAVLTLPFGGPLVVSAPLRAFAEVSRFHDLAWWALEAVTIPNPFGRNWPFTLSMLVALYFVNRRFRDEWERGLLWSLGIILILSPVLHPWYVTWLMPIAVWRGAHAWTILSLSALATLFLWDESGLWHAWTPNAITRSLVIFPPLMWWVCERILNAWRNPSIQKL